MNRKNYSYQHIMNMRSQLKYWRMKLAVMSADDDEARIRLRIASLEERLGPDIELRTTRIQREIEQFEQEERRSEGILKEMELLLRTEEEVVTKTVEVDYIT